MPWLNWPIITPDAHNFVSHFTECNDPVERIPRDFLSVVCNETTVSRPSYQGHSVINKRHFVLPFNPCRAINSKHPLIAFNEQSRQRVVHDEIVYSQSALDIVLSWKRESHQMPPLLLNTSKVRFSPSCVET